MASAGSIKRPRDEPGSGGRQHDQDQEDSYGPIPDSSSSSGGARDRLGGELADRMAGPASHVQYVPLKDRRRRVEAIAARRQHHRTSLFGRGGGAGGIRALQDGADGSGGDGSDGAGGGGHTGGSGLPEGWVDTSDEEDDSAVPTGKQLSLLEEQRAAAAAAGTATQEVDEAEAAEAKRLEKERMLLREVEQAAVPSLMTAVEHAQGIVYTESLKTHWRPPRYIEDMSEAEHNKVRQKYHIIVEGEEAPPPIKSFREMKFPQAILNALAAKGIQRPTPIQVQGLPVALSGRDMIGIAFTGSGKTMTFVLPMIMLALEEEMRMPLISGEGPVGMILVPSRELARQIFTDVQLFSEHLVKEGYSRLNSTLAIGGEPMRNQMDAVRRGCHMIVATPGRLKDLLTKKALNLALCKYIVLDEGDHMLDLGFDEDIQTIFSFFKQQRQTLIFSATMPKRFQDFARQALVRPVIVNVGRAGAANLDVVQEVEYVKQEAKILYLLECLQKTAPPVLIFCENKSDVDEIHEYLLLKGVGAVAVHGGKAQEERTDAVAQFRAGKKDVLVATDVAAKGLDFPDIQHVINFDMPSNIETYVHRIGRTGRCGKTGVATTFINRSVEESTLLDLKHLLREAKQRIPPVLSVLDDPEDLHVGEHEAEEDLGRGCSFCGGLGHRITNCPKLKGQRGQIAGAPKKDMLAGSGRGMDW